jgi:hypothetical protein
MSNLPTPAPASRQPNGRFGAGNPGRRAGSRNRISGQVAIAILEDFEAHQADILRRLREMWLPIYVRMVSGLLPRVTAGALPDLAAVPDSEVARRLMAMRGVIERIDRGEATLLDLEAVLMGEGEEGGA